MTTPMWDYFLANTVWSFGGLLVGYALGRTERDVSWLRKHIEKEHDDA